MMCAFSEVLSPLCSYLEQTFYRAGIVLKGTPKWTEARLLQLKDYFGSRHIQLGGHPREGYEWFDIKSGRRLLGQECGLLLVDLSVGFDADSFNAALGTLQGGGILVFVNVPEWAENLNPAQQWLRRALDQLIFVDELQSSVEVDFSPRPSMRIDRFEQQDKAIESIIHVVEGHRKRPFVLTADRGRGKSSALGIAASVLMTRRPFIQMIVTAPAFSSVDPIFCHLQRMLPDGQIQGKTFIYQQAKLQFIAPDELIYERPGCDLLLIDEAAAIPISMLTSLTHHYHRLVFSTTIHGYEGCGRGFTLKFLPWLKHHRPGLTHQKLSMPIRWAEGDPLEKWQYQTFLLDAELPAIEDIQDGPVQYRNLTRDELLNEPALFANLFSLLTNAHYQTTPNDLMGILSDSKITVFIAQRAYHLVGCILAIREGPLSPDAVARIQCGQHRPKGHLVPTSLVNQLGLSDAAGLSCCRVMRIAIHPAWQGRGYGSALLSAWTRQCSTDYIATSFGATSALLQFWEKNGFHPVKIGSRRDQASGCYSIVMIYRNSYSWFESARKQWSYYFPHALKTELTRLEPDVVRQLLKMCVNLPIINIPVTLIRNYVQGGSNYESVAVWISLYMSALPPEHIDMIDDLLIEKVLQNQAWSTIVTHSSVTGRKQIEQRIRDNLSSIIASLQCKFEL
ncbi:tRNA(Met) cytidine acetyltransferase TmcA [Vibrio spartinae]|uniref:tRNA(Met) cytidine acetyltransferase TmcA n=1 Tax=Vibrio spartinae TaxID=1918945 RepID=A0A1N6M1Y6_9VIBR|nr:GNAT family N-acetyltransferase [Vibrio spartinae]SIO93400.1 tRNA(Met) cytidine acetyltransferase TmcA [Vibrio spartinae]